MLSSASGEYFITSIYGPERGREERDNFLRGSGRRLWHCEHRERRSGAFVLPFFPHFCSLTRTRFSTFSMNRTGAALLKPAGGSDSRSEDQSVLSSCWGGKSTCTKWDPDKGKGWSDPGALKCWFSSTAQFKEEMPSGAKEGQCVHVDM